MLEDSIFLIDIVLNFFTGYYDQNNNLIMDKPKIATKYLKGWFLLDFVALFPFDIIIKLISDQEDQGTTSNKLLRLLRLPRLTKISKLLEIAKIKFIKSIIRNLGYNIQIVKMLVIMLYSNHLFSCYWFF